MLSKLFSAVKIDRDRGSSCSPLIAARPWLPPVLPVEQIRILVFQDSNRRGKVLVYDSCLDDIASIDLKKKGADAGGWGGLSASHSSASSAAAGPKKPLKSDNDMLGEMMFGAIPLAHKNTSTKVHVFRKPPQIVISKLFAIRPKDFNAYISKCTLSDPDFSSPMLTPAGIEAEFTSEKSWETSSDLRASFPAPAESANGSPLSSQLAPPESSISSSTPPLSPHPSPRPSLMERLYRQKRLSRSKNTSIEYGNFRRLESDDIDETPPRLRNRRPMYAIGVVFDLSVANMAADKNRVFQEFFFSHFSLIEFHVEKMYYKLLEAILQALTKPSLQTKSPGRNHSKLDFLSFPDTHLCENALQTSFILREAVSKFRQEISALYCFPRIQEPVWLNMVTFPHLRKNICKKFIREFISLIDDLDTAESNFFLSNVLTCVLSHHLAWVPTVAPSTDKKAEHLSKQKSLCLQLQARFFPYNPLWAQLGDLYGCIGSPVSLSRTIVIGKKSEHVCRLLYLLSYFIRCSEVFENVEHLKDPQTEQLSMTKPELSNPVSSDGCQNDVENHPILQTRLDINRSELPAHSFSKIVEKTNSNQISGTQTQEEPKANSEGIFLSSSDLLIEVPMPKSAHVRTNPDPNKVSLSDPFSISYSPDKLYCKSFGRSLLGGYFHCYVSDFALMGASKCDFMNQLVLDLKFSIQKSVLEEPVEKSNCILIDMDKLTVTVVSAHSGITSFHESHLMEGIATETSSPSHYLKKTLQTLRGLSTLGLPPETLLMHLEDRLQEFYHKSKLLARFLSFHSTPPVSRSFVADSLGVHESDVDFLCAVTSTHLPDIRSRLQPEKQASSAHLSS